MDFNTPDVGQLYMFPEQRKIWALSWDPPAPHEVQQGHAHRHAVGDLLLNQVQAGILHHLGAEFHTAIDRAGVQKLDIRVAQAQSLPREAEEVMVLLQAGEKELAHALLLQA